METQICVKDTLVCTTEVAGCGSAEGTTCRFRQHWTLESSRDSAGPRETENRKWLRTGIEDARGTVVA